MIERSATRSKVSLTVLEGTQRHLESLAELPHMANVHRLLGDPTRLKILLSLSHAKTKLTAVMVTVKQTSLYHAGVSVVP